MLVARLLDAVAVPGIGYWTDRTHTRIGPRKPWMLAGSLLGVAAFAVFFMPPKDAGNV